MVETLRCSVTSLRSRFQSPFLLMTTRRFMQYVEEMCLWLYVVVLTDQLFIPGLKNPWCRSPRCWLVEFNLPFELVLVTFSLGPSANWDGQDRLTLESIFVFKCQKSRLLRGVRAISSYQVLLLWLEYMRHHFQNSLVWGSKRGVNQSWNTLGLAAGRRAHDVVQQHYKWHCWAIGDIELLIDIVGDDEARVLTALFNPVIEGDRRKLLLELPWISGETSRFLSAGC